MIEINKKSDCSGCSACKNICPRNAISMLDDEKGFKYPSINHNYCINCGLCERACPIINKTIENAELPRAFAANNKNEYIRMQSSSGGMFTLIAENIIKKDGIVFGAVFNDNFLVEHVKVDCVEELFKIRGAKYIQSDINKTYKQAKECLEKGQHVLFSGTPCQIEGLKSYLMKNYDTLYTQDLICHGVPSKLVWNRYLEYRKKEDNGKLESIYFRDKENKGWNKYQLLFKYKEFHKYIDHEDDLYMKLFLSDIALRDSCYNCNFKKKHRVSDITLADFWGINKILPEINDEKGTSLLIINSKKGEDLLEEIKEKLDIQEVEFESAIRGNPSMTKSPKMKEEREKFFEDLNKLGVEELVYKYLN